MPGGMRLEDQLRLTIHSGLPPSTPAIIRHTVGSRAWHSPCVDVRAPEDPLVALGSRPPTAQKVRPHIGGGPVPLNGKRAAFLDEKLKRLVSETASE